MFQDSSVIEDIEEGKKDLVQKTDLSNVVEKLLNEEWWQAKSILNDREISAITTLYVIAQKYDITMLLSWIMSYLRFRISGNRGKGRTDIVEIAKYSIDRENERMERMADLMKSVRD